MQCRQHAKTGSTHLVAAVNEAERAFGLHVVRLGAQLPRTSSSQFTFTEAELCTLLIAARRPLFYRRQRDHALGVIMAQLLEARGALNLSGSHMCA